MNFETFPTFPSGNDEETIFFSYILCKMKILTALLLADVHEEPLYCPNEILFFTAINWFNAYAGILILKEAVVKAQSIGTQNIRDELLKLDTRTPFGRYQVNDKGVQIGHQLVVVQWQNGMKKIVWPDDHATDNPLFGK